MKKILIILSLIILPLQFLLGQGGFSKNYLLSGSLVSVCTDVLEAPNGNIIMTGLTYDALTGSNRLTIIGADSQGNQLWRKNYGSDKFEYLDNFLSSRSLIKGSDCFYFYSAVRDSNNKYLSVFIKFNYNGDTLWQKKYYDSADYLYIQGVTKSVDNGFLMTGFFEGVGNEYCLLIKTDSTGNELWRKKISKAIPNVQSGHNLIQDSATKKIVIAGYQYNGTASSYINYANIIVTDSLGTELQRVSNWGGTFKDIIQTKDKNIIAVGSKDQWNNSAGGFPRTKGFAIKVNLNNLNTIIWQKEFDVLSVYNEIETINELPTGDLILGGMLDTLKDYGVSEKWMLRLIKLDKNGNTKWNKLFSRDNVEKNTKKPRSLNLTQNAGFIIANELYYATNPRPYSITKIDSTGCDSSQFYCQTVGIEELKIINDKLKIYPNPASSVINVEFLSYNNETHKIEITTTLGELVQTTTIQQQQTVLNIKDLKSGVYFLQVYDDKKRLITNTKFIKQ